jgi:hypothetical protein
METSLSASSSYQVRVITRWLKREIQIIKGAVKTNHLGIVRFDGQAIAKDRLHQHSMIPLLLPPLPPLPQLHLL